MPKPALGRIVHVFVDPARNNGADVAPAMITRVWNEEGVNIRVMLDGTETPWMTSVTLRNDRESAEQVKSFRITDDGRRIVAAAFWPPIV